MKTWRLITYNIHKGVHPFRNLSVIERVALSLKASKADFLLLQEVVGEHLSERKMRSQLEHLSDERWPHHAYGKNAIFPTRNHGNAVLSAVPIRRFHNKDLSIYALERRGLLHCELMAPLPGMHLCSVHLDLFDFTRRKQVCLLVDYLREMAPGQSPLILGGDFNEWGQKAGKILERELGVNELSARSFPSWQPMLRLDRLYVRGVKIMNFHALEESPWDRLSDHLPLYLEFQVRSQAI